MESLKCTVTIYDFRSEDANNGTQRIVDILDDSAMENALNICHNVQVSKFK
jgi:hypothetical protein